MLRSLVVLSTVLLAGPVLAEVRHAEPGGFELGFETSVSTDPTTVFAGFEEIGKWWNPEHSYSGDPDALTLDSRPRGCFCESLDGGGVVHLTVVHSHPGQRLVLEGGLGPLQAVPVDGVMVWELTETNEGTRIGLSYGVSGSVKGGLEPWAAAVDGVIGEQLGRFVLWLQTGSPVAAPESPGP